MDCCSTTLRKVEFDSLRRILPGVMFTLVVMVAILLPSDGVAATTQIDQKTVDATGNAGNRWHRVDFTSGQAGNYTIDLSWDNSAADLAFSVFETAGPRKLVSFLGDANPKIWSGRLESNTDYFLGVWSRAGVAEFSALLTSPSSATSEFFIDTDVLDYGIADISAALGRRHNVVDFWPLVSGPVTIELEWEGDERMNLAIFDDSTGERLVVDVSNSGSPKQFTLDLDADKQYFATAWVEEGTAEWVLRRIQEVPNPDFNISDAPDGATRPNIILINTDDQRANTLEHLPAIQKYLVRKGTTYPNTIVPTPSCCPSRATTLSGKYVHNNGQFQQQRQNEQIYEQTFQRYLKDAGYFTGHSGKYLHWLETEDDIAPYWDRWTYISGGFYGVDMNFDGRYGKQGGYTTDIIFERAKDYLRDFEQRDDSSPWFVYIAPLSPHSPETPEYDFKDTEVAYGPIRTPAFREQNIADKPEFFKYRTIGQVEAEVLHTRRLQNLLSLDREVEQLIGYLENSGELDNTLIIFTSDNGHLMGEHQTWGKFTPYRDSVQVPMVITWPGNVRANVVNDAYVSHVDIAPTILEAAGVSTRGLRLDGRSIFRERRNTFYMEYFRDPQANGGRIGSWASIRNEAYQYTEWYDPEDESAVIFREYYDMVEDPYQINNLYGDDSPLNDPDFSTLSDDLQRARSCSGWWDCPL